MGGSKQPSSLGSSSVDGVPLFKTLREVIALVTDVMSAELGYFFIFFSSGAASRCDAVFYLVTAYLLSFLVFSVWPANWS